MSNRIYIQFTRFQNLDQVGQPCDSPKLGYRIFDDYESAYNNCFETIEEMIDAGLTPEGVFNYLSQHHDSFWEEAIDHGLYLNDVFVEPPKEEEEKHALQMWK